MKKTSFGVLREDAVNREPGKSGAFGGALRGAEWRELLSGSSQAEVCFFFIAALQQFRFCLLLVDMPLSYGSIPYRSHPYTKPSDSSACLS